MPSFQIDRAGHADTLPQRRADLFKRCLQQLYVVLLDGNVNEIQLLIWSVDMLAARIEAVAINQVKGRPVMSPQRIR